MSATAPPAADDRTLASRAARGDERAFGVLHDRHQPALLAFARQYVGDTAAAEDVVQNTFMTLHRTLLSGERLEHPRAWLYQVTRNGALNSVRARKADDPLDALAVELEARAQQIPEEVESREELREVIADIVALPVEQRAALTLFELSDLSQAEVATAMGMEAKRVKALVFQARSSLVDQRAARSASCMSIRDKLIESRGGTLNQRLIRHHLRRCEPCRMFRDELRDRRRRVALLLPVIPIPLLAHAASASAATGAAAFSTRARWLAGGSVTAAAATTVALAISAGGPDAPKRVSRALVPGVASAATPGPAAAPSRVVARVHHRAKRTSPGGDARHDRPSARRTVTRDRPPQRRVDPRVNPSPLEPGPTPEPPRGAPHPTETPAPPSAAPAPSTPPSAVGIAPAANTPDATPTSTPTPDATATPTPSTTPDPSPTPSRCGPNDNAGDQGQAHGQGPWGC